MNKPTSEHLGAAVAQALRPRKEAPTAQPGIEPLPPPSPRPYTVAVSRESGANGHLVARAVGARLGWPVYDQELLRKVAEEMGLNPGVLEGFDEKRVSWLQELLHGLSSVPGAAPSAYVHRLTRAVASLALKGECVILGRGAAQSLPADTTLRVRLIAPVEDRVKAIQARHGVSAEEALQKVAQTDRDRSRFVWDHFHKDPTDPHNYDLILNSARLGVEACADLIADTLRRWQARAVGSRPAEGGGRPEETAP